MVVKVKCEIVKGNVRTLNSDVKSRTWEQEKALLRMIGIAVDKVAKKRRYFALSFFFLFLFPFLLK